MPRNLSGITKTEADEIGRILGKNGTGSVVLGKVRAQYNLTESAVVTFAQKIEEALAKAKGTITESTLTETGAPAPGMSAQELNDRRRAEITAAGANRAQQNIQAASTQDLENLAVMLSGN